jgi:hypothetical protein
MQQNRRFTFYLLKLKTKATNESAKPADSPKQETSIRGMPSRPFAITRSGPRYQRCDDGGSEQLSEFVLDFLPLYANAEKGRENRKIAVQSNEPRVKIWEVKSGSDHDKSNLIISLSSF